MPEQKKKKKRLNACFVAGINRTVAQLKTWAPLLPPSHEKCNFEFEIFFIKSAILEVGSQLSA